VFLKIQVFWDVFYVMQQPYLGLGCLIVEISRSHTIRHEHAHTRAHIWTTLSKCLAHCKGRYVHNTRQIEELIIHALSGMQTCAVDHTAAGIGIFEQIVTSISKGSIQYSEAPPTHTLSGHGLHTSTITYLFTYLLTYLLTYSVEQRPS
jgi:hypothetical protein